MKIAITSTGKDLDAKLDERFGRCAYFLVVDSETYDFNVIDNTRAVNKGEYTGIATTKILINRDIKVLITKYIGPNAFRELNDVNIEIYQGKSGTVLEVLDNYYVERSTTSITDSF